MKKNRLIITVALILSILCTLTTCGRNTAVSFGTTHYDDMDASWDYLSVFKKIGEDIIAATTDGTLSANMICKMYGEFVVAYDRYSTAYAIHEINSNKNTIDEAETFDEINAVYSEAEAIYYKVCAALLDSDYADKA